MLRMSKSLILNHEVSRLCLLFVDDAAIAASSRGVRKSMFSVTQIRGTNSVKGKADLDIKNLKAIAFYSSRVY